MTEPVRHRRVFYICGFDWKDWRYYATLFRRELGRYAAVSGSVAVMGEPAQAGDGRSVTWTVESARQGRDPVRTDYEFLLWDEVIGPFRRRSILFRLGAASLVLLDNVITGTLFKIGALNWRFLLFWLYPIVMMALDSVLGTVAGIKTFDLTAGAGAGSWVATVTGLAAGSAIFYALLHLIERRGGLVLMLLDALIFNMFHARRKVPAMSRLIDDWVERIAEAARSDGVDEVLVIGHSWGTVHAVEVGGILAGKADGSGRPCAGVSVMTIGSTTPAVACHPAAGWLRERVRDLAVSPHILWVEYQARKDVINFPGTDVVEGCGVELDAEDRRAVRVEPVRFRDLLDADFYRAIRNNLFRLHFQFVMANDNPGQTYDFFDIVTGSETLWDRHGVVRQIPASDR